MSEQASGKEKTTMPASGEQKVKITKVEPNRTQPRKNFDEDSLIELADSILSLIHIYLPFGTASSDQ